MSVLLAHNISCEKSDRALFSGLHLSVSPGELVYLTGENGAGKTSLLRILVGLGMPSKNTFDDVDNEQDPNDRHDDEHETSLKNQKTYVKINTIDVHKDINGASEQLLYFGHKLGLNQLMSPVENLQSWCLQQNIETNIDTITSILDELGLTGLEDIALKNLSAGQQRRVALAKLWLKSYANLWVLDEPFTALDVNFIAMLEDKITAFLKSGGAVLMTSHQSLNIDYPMTNMHLEYQW